MWNKGWTQVRKSVSETAPCGVRRRHSSSILAVEAPRRQSGPIFHAYRKDTDYLTELQLHAEALAVCPERWMPWNYQDTLI